MIISIYLMLFFASLAVLSSAYALTVPHRIQYLLSIGEEDNVDSIVESLPGGERFYLLSSAAPLFIIPMLFFSELPRAIIYAVILIGLVVLSLTRRKSFIKSCNLIRLESAIEIVLYSDIIRNCIVIIWG